MSEDNPHSNTGVTAGGLIGLVVVIALGWWGYSHFFNKDYSQPWWSGTAYQHVCNVHVPQDQAYCVYAPVTVKEKRIATLVLPDELGRNGETVVITTNDCDKATVEGGMTGKGNRYCVVGEIGGDREWQVNERR